MGDPSLEILPYSPSGDNYNNLNIVNNEKKKLTVSQNEIALKFFPNPTEGSLNIEINNTFKGSGTIEIYDLSGRLVDERTIELNDGFTSYVLDCSEFNLKSGLYVVRMNILGGNSYSKKFLYTEKPD